MFHHEFLRPLLRRRPKNSSDGEKITFTSDKIGGEWISLFCNQSCTPELFSLEGENPRVVMDMKRIFQIQTKTRNINTGGKLVKRIRNYLDKQTNILRVVLDLEPSKNYIVCPVKAPFNNTYVLKIEESEQKPGGSWDDKGSPLSQEKRITILRPDLRPREQQGNLKEAAPSPENRSTAKAAAIDTLTRIIAAHPQDSLSYRLRGNAYNNLGDRQKALEDWTQAARLGDTTLQSYLDFLEVKWRKNHAP